MIKTIMFDEKCFHWSDNYDLNRAFIESNTNWLYDIFNYKGYIYLDRIYEVFGAKWNPDEPNDCIRYGVNQFMLSWIHLGHNKFEINIYY